MFIPRVTELACAEFAGERTGEGAGRGRRGRTPFIIAVETSSDGRPLHTRLQVVRGFQAGETKRLCARVVAGTMLANIKNSLLAAHRVVAAKHLPRYLGAFAWRFNRRFVLKTIHERLAIAATTTPPMPYRLLKLAEARW